MATVRSTAASSFQQDATGDTGICDNAYIALVDDRMFIAAGKSTPQQVGVKAGTDNVLQSVVMGDDVSTAAICPGSDGILQSGPTSGDDVLGTDLRCQQLCGVQASELRSAGGDAKRSRRPWMRRTRECLTSRREPTGSRRLRLPQATCRPYRPVAASRAPCAWMRAAMMMMTASQRPAFAEMRNSMREGSEARHGRKSVTPASPTPTPTERCVSDELYAPFLRRRRRSTRLRRELRRRQSHERRRLLEAMPAGHLRQRRSRGRRGVRLRSAGTVRRLQRRVRVRQLWRRRSLRGGAV